MISAICGYWTMSGTKFHGVGDAHRPATIVVGVGGDVAGLTVSVIEASNAKGLPSADA